MTTASSLALEGKVERLESLTEEAASVRDSIIAELGRIGEVSNNEQASLVKRIRTGSESLGITASSLCMAADKMPTKEVDSWLEGLTDREQRIIECMLASTEGQEWFRQSEIDLSSVEFSSESARSQAFAKLAERAVERGILEGNGKARGGSKHRFTEEFRPEEPKSKLELFLISLVSKEGETGIEKDARARNVRKLQINMESAKARRLSPAEVETFQGEIDSLKPSSVLRQNIRNLASRNGLSEPQVLMALRAAEQASR